MTDFAEFRSTRFSLGTGFSGDFNRLGTVAEIGYRWTNSDRIGPIDLTVIGDGVWVTDCLAIGSAPGDDGGDFSVGDRHHNRR